MAVQSPVTFKILRFDPEKDKAPYFASFQVTPKTGMSVLEGLFDILENQDGSLGLRFACRHAVCGSCAMAINGCYRLACQTLIKDLNTDLITVRPLGHLPVIKDLVVDMEPFYAKYEKIMPYLVGPNGKTDKELYQSIADRKKIDEQIDCILCGCCYASCPVTLTDPDYLGPAALLKADRFYADSRDQVPKDRLKLVDGEHGVWRCHTVFNCYRACPKELNPTASIAHLKRGLLWRKLLGRIVR